MIPILLPFSSEVPLDLRNRLLGKIFINFRQIRLFTSGVEGMPQLGKRARRSSNDECFHIPSAHESLQGRGHMVSKAMLFKLMPVRRLHAAAAVCSCTLEAAAWAIGALLFGREIVIQKDTLGDEVLKPLVAGIA